jgi:hypothetical protein
MASVQALVVAGGGGGGTSLCGGGGGGGGVLYSSAVNVSVQAYSITVGTGGGPNTNGNNSVFATLTAVGGGAGGGQGAWNTGEVGHNGGSGGGGECDYSYAKAGGSGTAGQGNSGGNGLNYSYPAYRSGGGGGAGAAGGNASTGGPGAGGAGAAYSISGSSVYYGGGGGGAAYSETTTNCGYGAGGNGGGGNGESRTTAGVQTNATSGSANTGGGGGGNTDGTQTSGGSGIVIIRYVTGTVTATGGTVTTVGSDTVHTFTSSGTFTVTAALTTSSDYAAQKFRPLSQTKFINDANLLAYWSMDGNSNDSKGSFNGTDTNVSYVAGKFGSASSYNGTSSKIQLPNSMITTTGSFSVWIKTSNSDQGILGMQDVAPGNTSNWWVSILGVTTAGKIRATWGWQNTELTITSTRSVNDNLWHHLVITSNLLNTYLYIDGTLEGAFGASVANAYNTYLNLGVCMGSTNWGYSSQTWKYFNGLIEDAAFFNRMLSREEVSELYQGTIWAEDLPSLRPVNGLYSTSLINDANLVSYWRLDGNSRDSKGSNHGTDTAMTYSSSVGRFGQGAYFLNTSNSKIDTTVPVNFNNNFTINLWAYRLAEISSWSWLIDFNDYGNAGTPALVLTVMSNKVRWSYGTWFTDGSPNYSVVGDFPLNSWGMITVQRSGTTLNTFINGILVDTTTTSVSTIPTSGTMHIGRGPSTSDWYYGYLDDISMFSRALSSSEIQTIYNAGSSSMFRPLGSIPSLRNDNSLVSYWKLDGNVVDSKGSNNGTATSLIYTAGPTFAFGQCAVLNGSSSMVDCGNAASLQITNATISAWIKTSNAGTGHRGIIVKQSAFGMFLLDNVFCTYDWNANTSRSTGVNLADGKWHHVVVSYQNGVANGTVLYIDGARKLNTLNTITSQSTQLVIGNGGTTGTTQYFAGSIADAFIFNRSLSASEIQQIYIQKQLVGYWKLNGDSTDYSGNGFHGTDANMTYGIGRFDKCAIFNGTSSLITPNINPSTTLGQAFSISAWIYPTAVSNYRGAIGNHAGSNPTYGIIFCQYADGVWGFGYGTGTAGFANGVNINSSLIPNNAWSHVVATFHGNTSIQVYVNGRLVGSSTETLPINHTSSIWIGKAYAAADRFFQGNIEEVKMYSTILSQQDVIKMYTQSKGRFGII